MASPAAEEVAETSIADIPSIVSKLRAEFDSRSDWTLDHHRVYRIDQLRALRAMMEENEQKINEALWKDLHKAEQEALMIETSVIVEELDLFIDNLHKWIKPQSLKKDLLNMLNSIYLKPEPHGIALIIGAWNYPFQTSLLPVIGAIAAGNSVVLKPSEVATSSSALLAELIPKYLDPAWCAVVQGGAEVSQALLKEKFDYVFFTGSTSIGRLVMKAAAEHLTPVTLELGGKSPVIVADDANIEVTARRIMWGKLLNAGQTCVAPDYVLSTKETQDRLIEACKRVINEFFGQKVRDSADYSRIINKRNFERLCKLMDTSKGKNLLSGDRSEEEKYIAPALYVDITEDDPLMQEEIFGPVLPFVAVENMDEAVKIVNKRGKPLVVYLFSAKKTLLETVCGSVSAGSVSHNSTVLFAGVYNLPFGGVGPSGMGKYHGKASFDTFTHYKSVYSTGTKLDSFLSVTYPPYSDAKIKRLHF